MKRHAFVYRLFYNIRMICKTKKIGARGCAEQVAAYLRKYL